MSWDKCKYVTENFICVRPGFAFAIFFVVVASGGIIAAAVHLKNEVILVLGNECGSSCATFITIITVVMALALFVLVLSIRQCSEASNEYDMTFGDWKERSRIIEDIERTCREEPSPSPDDIYGGNCNYDSDTDPIDIAGLVSSMGY